MLNNETNPSPLDDPLGDDRLRFFLKNRALIEQWASLGKEVTAAIDEILQGLAPEMEALASRLGQDVFSGLYGPASQWPRFAFARSTWPRVPEEPLLAVTLEWQANRVNPSGPNGPYVGIRIPDPLKVGSSVTDRLKAITKGRLRGYTVLSQWWPAHKRLPATRGSEWWVDVPGWRAEMVDAVAAAWPQLESAVEEALAGTARPPA